MGDTDFYVPESKHDRFCSLYAAADPEDPLKPGLSKTPDLFGDYTRPRPLESGGGGLVGTITDYSKFVRMLMGGGEFQGARIVSESTLNMMRTNQLPDGVALQLPSWVMPNTVFGLGFALKQKPAQGRTARSDRRISLGRFSRYSLLDVAQRQSGGVSVHPEDAWFLAPL